MCGSQGEVKAQGTAENPILFNAIDRLAPWGGIEVVSASGELRLSRSLLKAVLTLLESLVIPIARR